MNKIWNCKTSISKIGSDDVTIRGQKLSSLIENKSFSDSIFLLLKGNFPNVIESKIFSAMLTSIIDHGTSTSSALTTRFVTSGGNSLNTAVGAGVLALGEYHGGAIENSMVQIFEFIKKSDLELEDKLKELISKKKPIYGFGHKIYKEGNPRVKTILKLCQKLNYTANYVNTAIKIESLINKIKGKKIILNIDGIIASLLLSMGFKSSVGKGIFIIGRISGLVAHSIEEKEKPVRRLNEDKITYIPNTKAKAYFF